MELSTEKNATPIDAVASQSATTGVAVGVGVGAGIGAGLWGVVAPVVHWIGFGAGGIATGSTAASMMSTAAIANGGGVAVGSTVAVLQNVGAVGLATPAGLGLIATGVVVGGAAVGAKSFLGGRSPVSVSEGTNEKTTEGGPAGASESASWLWLKWPAMGTWTATAAKKADVVETRTGSDGEARGAYQYFSAVKNMVWRSDENASEPVLQSKFHKTHIATPVESLARSLLKQHCTIFNGKLGYRGELATYPILYHSSYGVELFSSDEEPDSRLGARLRLAIDVVNACCACRGLNPATNQRFWRQAMINLWSTESTRFPLFEDYTVPFTADSFACYKLIWGTDDIEGGASAALWRSFFYCGNSHFEKESQATMCNVMEMLRPHLAGPVRPLQLERLVDGKRVTTSTATRTWPESSAPCYDT